MNFENPKAATNVSFFCMKLVQSYFRCAYLYRISETAKSFLYHEFKQVGDDNKITFYFRFTDTNVSKIRRQYSHGNLYLVPILKYDTKGSFKEYCDLWN